MTILHEAVVRLPDGRNLGYAEHGVHDGIPVLYFHGMPGGRFYDLDGEALRRHGIRLLSVERPSVGLSDPQPRRTLLDWPRDVEAFADAVGIDRFGVIGTSAGAPYALACGHELPDRCTAVVLQCGSCPDVTDPSLDDRAGYPDDVRRFRTDPDGLRRDLETKIESRRAGWFADPGAFFDEWLLLWPAIDRGAFVNERAFWERVFAATYGGPGTADEWVVQASPFGFSPEAIAVPVHAWHGDADEVAPLELVERLIGRVQQGMLTVCPGEGHYLSKRHHPEMCAVFAAAAA